MRLIIPAIQAGINLSQQELQFDNLYYEKNI